VENKTVFVSVINLS